MRTVICHFFNEAYLLPWWLKHHLALFDHGIMIDHGSTDASCDIIRELAPQWRLVRSRLMNFDAYLTDFEVMSYEQQIPGWKIALNVTEFLMPIAPLNILEQHLISLDRKGCAASGMVIVDHQPEVQPESNLSLPFQKHWGIDDNAELDPQIRVSHGMAEHPNRNRFFHRCEVGMYGPGRHYSFHQDSRLRFVDLMVFHFNYAPWNQEGIRRKTQIGAKVGSDDLQRGWGVHHRFNSDKWQGAYELIRQHSIDLNTHPYAAQAIAYTSAL
jgi:hypothetical protein